MGVVPIVNENDTVSVSVSGFTFISICYGVFVFALLMSLCRKSNLATTIHCLQSLLP